MTDRQLYYCDKSLVSSVVYSFKTDYYSDNLDLDELAVKYSTYSTVLVSYIGRMPIGYIAYYRNNVETGTAYISMVVVKHDYRNQGVATQMIQMVITNCKTNGFTAVRLEVNNSNQKAICLYRKHGFVYEKPAHDDSFYYSLLL